MEKRYGGGADGHFEVFADFGSFGFERGEGLAVLGGVDVVFEEFVGCFGVAQGLVDGGCELRALVLGGELGEAGYAGGALKASVRDCGLGGSIHIFLRVGERGNPLGNGNNCHGCGW